MLTNKFSWLHSRPFQINYLISCLRLHIQCKYTATAVEALVAEVGVVPAPPGVAAPGPLRVELRIGNGVCATKGCIEGKCKRHGLYRWRLFACDCITNNTFLFLTEQVAYTSFYADTDYPVTKVLRDPVYIEVHILERTDPNIVLTLGRCWANTNPNPNYLPQWDLLING